MHTNHVISCLQCHKSKTVRDSVVVKRQKFCSRKCSAIYRAEHGYKIRTKPPSDIKSCPICNNKFESTKSNPKKYCSKICYWKSKIGEKHSPRHGKRVWFTCEWCGSKNFIPNNLAVKRKFCSRKCFQKYMHTNQNNFSNASEFYLSKEWKILRDKIKERDHNQCIHCPCKSNLIVHHIIPRANWGNPNHYHDEADNEDNLETVCAPCHWSLHDFLRSNTH